MNFGNYDIFDTVDEKNAKVVLEQMRNNLAKDLLYWKTQSPSEMAKLMENQISAIDIGIKALEKSQINNDMESKTNADKIRLMSDDELAMNMMCPNENGLAEIKCDESDECNCYECLLEWLSSEAEAKPEELRGGENGK